MAYLLRFSGGSEYLTATNLRSDVALQPNQTAADAVSYVAYLKYTHKETRTDWRSIIEFGGIGLYTFNNRFARKGQYLNDIPMPVVDSTYIIRLRVDAGVNGVKHGSFATSISADDGATWTVISSLESVSTIAGISRIFGNSSGECSAADLLSLKVYNKEETTLLNDYVPSGSGNVLIDVLAGNNATQAGAWPSDDSEWVFYSTGGTTYTLTATGATYSYSGGAATTVYNRVMQAAGGSFSYAGGSATLTYNPAGVVYTLNADGGVYSYSGGNATTAYNRVMAASGGAFAYSGGSATLSRNYSMAASGGVYNYAGGNATLNYTPATGYRLTALGASFSYAGGDATFTYSQTYPQASASDFTVSGRLSESVSYSAIMYESTTYSGRLN